MMRLFGVTIWRERPGVISLGPCWVVVYGCWMHTGDSFLDVVWNVMTEWKHDRHLVG